MMFFNNDNYNNVFNVLVPCYKNSKIIRHSLAGITLNFSQELFNLLFGFQSQFETDLRDAIGILERIYGISHYTKQINYSIADAVEDWIDLKLNCTNALHESFIDREMQKMLTNVSLTAHYLHPVYKGEKLECLASKYLEMVHRSLIEQLDEKAVDGLLNFEKKNGICECLFKKKFESAILFWEAVRPLYPILADFSLKLLKVPAYTSHQQLVFQAREGLNLDEKSKATELYYLLKCNETVKRSSHDGN